LQTAKVKIADTISRGAFISFVIAIFLFMITNADILVNGDWDTKVIGIPTCLFYYILKVSGYILITALLIIFGIKHPGINVFVTELIEVLRDGKLTPEEKIHLIDVFKDEFLGGWADLSNLVAEQAKKLEKIELPKPL